MRQSQLFTKTQRSFPQDEESLNAQLLIRAGYIHKEMAGVYSFLPLGLRVLNNIMGIIREEMNALGGQEVLLTSLQSPEVWQKSGRWDDKVVDVWFKTKLKNKAELGLANTHEEVLAFLMTHHIASWRDLPQAVYQFQTKFRNELRSRSGLLRTREFLMKDMYSFSRNQQEHDEFYERAKASYHRIFERLGIGRQTLLAFASGGSFSKYSHEFQTLCEAGEDTIFVCMNCTVAVNREIIEEQSACPQCQNKDLVEKRATEVGNIFPLGTKYADAFGLRFANEQGEKQSVVMGSYGIGPARVMATIVELSHDEQGLNWPRSVAPFPVHLIALPGGEKEAEKLYGELKERGREALYDDRDASAGEKLTDADLLGLPLRVVASSKSLEQGGFAVKRREEDKETILERSKVDSYLSNEKIS